MLLLSFIHVFHTVDVSAGIAELSFTDTGTA